MKHDHMKHDKQRGKAQTYMLMTPEECPGLPRPVARLTDLTREEVKALPAGLQADWMRTDRAEEKAFRVMLEFCDRLYPVLRKQYKAMRAQSCPGWYGRDGWPLDDHHQHKATREILRLVSRLSGGFFLLADIEAITERHFRGRLGKKDRKRARKQARKQARIHGTEGQGQ